MRKRTYKTVTHVGTLNKADREDWSLEGEGLSVSRHPDEWRQIARLGGRPEWTVARRDGSPLSFCDFHALTRKDRAEITRWGMSEGLVTEITVYAVPAYDEDGEECGHYLFPTYDEALAEVDGLGDTPEDEAAMVTQRTVLKFLDGRNPRGGTLGNAFDVLTTMWVEQHTDHDGVWWDDELDVWNLSAPRGVILPSRLDNMEFSK